MSKPGYIQNLESKDNFFSVMDCHELKGDFLKFLNEKKLTRVYEKSSINYDGIITYELLPCDNLENQIKIFSEIYN